MQKQLTSIPQKLFSTNGFILCCWFPSASFFFNCRDSSSGGRKLILDQQNNEMYYPFHLIILTWLSINMFKNTQFPLTHKINWMLMRCPTINTKHSKHAACELWNVSCNGWYSLITVTVKTRISQNLTGKSFD